MSKSLKRVVKALQDAGLDGDVLHMEAGTRTAQDAADAAGCELDQIVKSIIFQGETSGDVILFLTAGGNRVDPDRAAAVAGEPVGRADAALVRERTGFAIGGVSPVGHLSPPRMYWDPRISDFATVYAAAGTPQHIFPIAPDELLRITGAEAGNFTA
ncbi:YbaK/EbsC family protein [Pelagovum pacificum]|uniref:YbaK/EbsC family protein n=1 Tax=Pelagovum pacificum TaxID=2588711 RepID=A0A5C5GCE9_9RHOB|nr:YbaK/EbsC family protein [Pelagovum pacificum]QQA44417.1 YbaK/EbsC family protein [Pelagovum pacificum]TNY32465.1 YbaK/EbsC family protein [Pelagovum pacificum]